MFSTGRGLQTAGALWRELGVDGPAVLLNGAEIWEKPGKLLKRSFLPRDTVRKLHEIASARAEWYWGYSVESLTGRADWTPEMFERDWMKFGMGTNDMKVLAGIRKELAGWGTLELTWSVPINIEISVKGVTKENGVREICKRLGITMEDVIAFGDSDNDLCLLRAAGMGVAMGNAEEHVKAAADAITRTNNEDGVAHAVREFVFG